MNSFIINIEVPEEPVTVSVTTDGFISLDFTDFEESSDISIEDIEIFEDSSINDNVEDYETNTEELSFLDEIDFDLDSTIE